MPHSFASYVQTPQANLWQRSYFKTKTVLPKFKENPKKKKQEGGRGKQRSEEAETEVKHTQRGWQQGDLRRPCKRLRPCPCQLGCPHL